MQFSLLFIIMNLIKKEFMIRKYEKYLDFIGSYLEKYFEQQKPYIHCKEGCSICCETGLYPLSKLEFDYLMVGMGLLNDTEKKQVLDNIQQTKKSCKSVDGKDVYYQCPFLLNKRCSVYNHRSIICRTYGLLQFVTDKDDKNSFHIPCCVTEGLNYSSVYDESTQTISVEKFLKLEIKEEPLSYYIGLKYLLDNEYTADLEFGEVKNLINWFE